MPPWVVLALAVIAISFGGPLTRLADAHPLAIAVWRLGLSLVAKIVGDHGGVVEFENLERGAAFRVRLPAFRGGERST